jgi:lysozyme
MFDNLIDSIRARLFPTPSTTPINPSGNPVVTVMAEGISGCTTAAWGAYETLLRSREGCKLTVYRDTKGRLTVGIGHLVLPQDNLVLGQTITQTEVDGLFRRDAGNAMLAAVSLCRRAGITSQAFLPYMASVCFQLGVDWPTEYPTMWALVAKGDYEGAANDDEFSEGVGPVRRT